MNDIVSSTLTGCLSEQLASTVQVVVVLRQRRTYLYTAGIISLIVITVTT